MAIAIVTPIDTEFSDYQQYAGANFSMGRILHYLAVIGPLRYAESVKVCPTGAGLTQVTYRDEAFAHVDWSKGYPHFTFVHEYSSLQKAFDLNMEGFTGLTTGESV